MKIWGVAGVLLALGALAAGCTGSDRPVPATKVTPTAQASSSPAATPAGDGVPASVEVRGSGGLDVRYLDADGTTRTLRVEDFPR